MEEADVGQRPAHWLEGSEVDHPDVRTEQGKLYLFVGIDRTSKFTFVELHEKATRRIAGDFLRHLIAVVPYRAGLCAGRHRSSSRQAQTSLDQRPDRANEPDY